MSSLDILPGTLRARELYGDFWFNARSVQINDLRGQVILVEFWDCASIACERGRPYIMEWIRRYGALGLVVIGVHTPRFPFAREPELVQRAIERSGITYPVVMDNDALIASHYGSRTWPSLFLIDRNGFIRFQHSGEGDYGSVEHVIQTLLYDAGVGEVLPPVMEPMHASERNPEATPELFAGYIRGTFGNVEGSNPESTVDYKDPLIYIDGRIYASGRWRNGKDSLEFQESPGGKGAIVVDYHGLEVYAVLQKGGTTSAALDVLQDDRPLTGENRGNDVECTADGRSVLCVDEPRAYHVVRNSEHGEHLLRLGTSSNGLALYAIKFVSSALPEFIANN